MTTTATKTAAPTAPKTATAPKATAIIEFATDTLAARLMRVNALTPEQLAVYQRTATRFERDVSDDMSADDARKALDRAIRIVMSPLADDADIKWIEDQFLEGTLTLAEAASILTLTMEAFASKEKAPTTGPAPKKTAARRAR